MSDDLKATLVEATYESLRFPIVGDADVEGGHDAIAHEAWRRRGADHEWTGQRPNKGTITAAFLTTIQGYGLLYPDGFRAFIAKLGAVPIGRFTHPVYGTFPALMRVWKVKAQADKRAGVHVELEWVEDRGQASAQPLDPTAGLSDGDATAQAVTQAQAADAALTAVGGTFVPVTPVYTTQITLLRTGALGYLATATAFRALRTATETALGLRQLATFTARTASAVHAAVAALEALRVTTYRAQAQYLPNGLRTYVTPRAMTAAEVAWAEYRDIDQAALVRAANPLPDVVIPAGTALVILPT